jgi:hypothetical protein
MTLSNHEPPRIRIDDVNCAVKACVDGTKARVQMCGGMLCGGTFLVYVQRYHHTPYEFALIRSLLPFVMVYGAYVATDAWARPPVDIGIHNSEVVQLALIDGALASSKADRERATTCCYLGVFVVGLYVIMR